MSLISNRPQKLDKENESAYEASLEVVNLESLGFRSIYVVYFDGKSSVTEVTPSLALLIG